MTHGLSMVGEGTIACRLPYNIDAANQVRAMATAKRRLRPSMAACVLATAIDSVLIAGGARYRKSKLNRVGSATSQISAPCLPTFEK